MGTALAPPVGSCCSGLAAQRVNCSVFKPDTDCTLSPRSSKTCGLRTALASVQSPLSRFNERREPEAALPFGEIPTTHGTLGFPGSGRSAEGSWGCVTSGMLLSLSELVFSSVKSRFSGHPACRAAHTLSEPVQPGVRRVVGVMVTNARRWTVCAVPPPASRHHCV